MNNYPIATILGGGGFIGRYLVRNLTKKNFRCIVPTRNPFTKGYLKTQAAPGAIEFINFNTDEIKNAIENSDIVINLCGILYETRKQKFNTIHVDLPETIATLCAQSDVKKFVHVSAIGASQESRSKYQQSKFLGEEKLDRLNDHLWIGASMDGKPLNQLNSLNQKWILVMGSEAHGIEKPIKSKLNMLYSIPKIGKGESLNVGVAMGIFLSKLAL